MNDYIDIYCERLVPGFWAEPVNALTNLAFIIAALAALHLARKQGAPDWRSGALIGLIFMIGAGSFLFHTFATGWAQLADVLPILAYQVTFITLYSRDVLRRPYWQTALLFTAFIGASMYAENMPGHWLNGSMGYVPALVFVLALGSAHRFFARRERWGLLAAGAVFALSLSLRSVDMALCDAFPMGTHFLWHSLNGVVLYLTARAYILNAQRKDSNPI